MPEKLRGLGGPALAVALWILFMVALSSLLGSFYLGLASTVGINALLALGLILVTGFAGQFSLAQGAFFGIGAYGSGLLTMQLGWPVGLALVVSAAVATAVGYALGRPIFRLRGHFLAMATLALTEIFFLTVNNLSVTGASSGFGVEPFSLFGFAFTSLPSQFLLVWLTVGAVLWASLRIRRSREGRALRALRGHEAAAASCGVGVSASKTRVLAGSAFVGSIAGSIYAHTILFVNPPPFGVLTSVDVLAIAVIGGLVYPWGAVVGAIALQLVREVISAWLPSVFGAGAVGAGETLVFGAVFVLVLVLRPDGIVGALREGLSNFLCRRLHGAQCRWGVMRSG